MINWVKVFVWACLLLFVGGWVYLAVSSIFKF